MPMRRRTVATNRGQGGTTLIELLIVAAIIVATTVLAVPLILNSIAQYQLRTSADGLTAMLQRARLQAVRNNRTYTVQSAVVASGSFSYTRVFLDLNGDLAASPGEPMVQLPRNVSLPAGGTPNPPASLGFAPLALPLTFNARGTPCVLNAGVCNNAGTAGFMYYVQSTQMGTNWAAVSVSPSGRFKVWSRDSKTGQWSD